MKHEQKLIPPSLHDFKKKLEKGLISKNLSYWTSHAGYTEPKISKATTANSGDSRRLKVLEKRTIFLF